VVKLAKQKKHCAVYAERADKPFIKAQFAQLEWSASHDARVVFALAIAESEIANLQVLATAEIVPMTRERRSAWSGVGDAPPQRVNQVSSEEGNDSLEQNFRR
jgi:hypothetical protein